MATVLSPAQRVNTAALNENAINFYFKKIHFENVSTMSAILPKHPWVKAKTQFPASYQTDYYIKHSTRLD